MYDRGADEHDPILGFMRSLKHMQKHIKQVFHAIYKEESLPQAHAFLMFQLYQCNSLKVTDISEEFCITAGAVTGMTDKLVVQGYVKRIRSEEDRRIVYVVLTDEGREKIMNIRKKLKQRMTEIFADVPQERVIEYTNVLNQVAHLLESYGLKGEE